MFLGIDLGTSTLKALLVDERGEIITSSQAPLAVSRPKPSWSEQDASAWWQATLTVLDELRDKNPRELSAVRAIGLSGQMHGATLLDAADRPLRPAILWNDTRSAKECEELKDRVGELTQITGNLAMPGFTAPKLLWVAKHEPALFAKVSSVLLPKDYLRLCLCGEKVSDMSDAAGTLWLDVAARRWSEVMLAATGLGVGHMPRLVEGSEVSGCLSAELKQRFGMSGEVLIAGGGGDNAASAVGIGAVVPGQGFVSLGTSGVVFVVNERFSPNPARAVHAFCHALPGRWHQMSVMLSAASCLDWVKDLVSAESVAAALAEVETLDERARARAPLFLPYLSGERTPHNNPAATGVFFGLTSDTDRAALVYAVLEGVAFGLGDGVAALRDAGTTVGMLSLAGGGSRSAFWSQLIADVLSVPLQAHRGGETGAALGAARLAALACGLDEASVCTAPPVARIFTPSARPAAWLAERQVRFRALYPRLVDVWE